MGVGHQLVALPKIATFREHRHQPQVVTLPYVEGPTVRVHRILTRYCASLHAAKIFRIAAEKEKELIPIKYQVVGKTRDGSRHLIAILSALRIPAGRGCLCDARQATCTSKANQALSP